jgi:mono/diheme cytochrome c family protein
MPTSTKTNTAATDFETASQRAREANEHLAGVSRKVTTAYLDGVEKYVAGAAQFERKFGTQTQVDAVASLLKTHADLTEEITKVSVSAARELITA